MLTVLPVILGGLILIAVVYLIILVRKGSAGVSGTDPVVIQELKNDLQTIAKDLTERIAKGSGDTRTELVKEIGEGFQKVQQRVEEQLSKGRNEQSQVLSGTTEKLEKKFQELQKNNQDQMEVIRGKIEGQLSAIGDKVQSKLDENIKEGFRHFQDVQNSLKAAEDQLKNVGALGTSINDLSNLLKLPHMRGKFGEAELDRIVSDFIPAHLIERGANIDGAGQVEFLIKFPKTRLPIDSKFPREQVAPLFETGDPVKLTEARKQLQTVIKTEGNRIAKYIQPDQGITMALMFLPSETLYFEVIRDESILNDLYKKKVFPASPNTLAITLKSIAIAQDYYEMSKGVEKTIEELQKTKKHLGNFMTQFDKIGDGLSKAEESYRVAQGHLGKYTGSIAKLTGTAVDEVEAQDSTPRLPGN